METHHEPAVERTYKELVSVCRRISKIFREASEEGPVAYFAINHRDWMI